MVALGAHVGTASHSDVVNVAERLQGCLHSRSARQHVDEASGLSGSRRASCHRWGSANDTAGRVRAGLGWWLAAGGLRGVRGAQVTVGLRGGEGEREEAG